jgi:hypothetical protein
MALGAPLVVPCAPEVLIRRLVGTLHAPLVTQDTMAPRRDKLPRRVGATCVRKVSAARPAVVTQAALRALLGAIRRLRAVDRPVTPATRDIAPLRLEAPPRLRVTPVTPATVIASPPLTLQAVHHVSRAATRRLLVIVHATRAPMGSIKATQEPLVVSVVPMGMIATTPSPTLALLPPATPVPPVTFTLITKLRWLLRPAVQSAAALSAPLASTKRIKVIIGPIYASIALWVATRIL